MNDVAGATPLVEIVHVLGNHRYPVPNFQLCQQAMGPVGLGGFQLAPAVVVEPQHQLLIPGKRLGRGHIVHTVLLPQPAVVTECGEAALGADTCACQYNDVVLHQSKILPGFMMPLGSNTFLIPLR